MLPFPELIRGALEAKSRSLLMGLRHTQLPRIKLRQAQFRKKSDAEIKQIIDAIRKRIATGEKPDDLEVNLFAAVAEASRRTLGLEPFDTQLLAALLLKRNKVIQMNTGEGKTLVAPFAAISAVVRGNRSIVVTANPYLSSRDAAWMRPIYQFFDIDCGSVDPYMSQAQRYEAYDNPVVYAAGDQLIFDYLRKHNAVSRNHDLPISRSFAILDEIDNILIDNGGREYVIGNGIPFRSSAFAWANENARQFRIHEHFDAQFSQNNLTLTDQGRSLLRKLSSEFTNLQQLHAEFYLRSALKAHVLYRRDFEYLVEDDRILLISSVTGHPEPGWRLPFGLQQAIEEKEGVSHTDPIHTLNKITMQGFYRGFSRICGMSGSAIHNSLEFAMFYKLDVVPVPPHVPCVRRDETDVVYRTRSEQIRAITENIHEVLAKQRPVLVGTLSVGEADTLSQALLEAEIPHNLLTARNYSQEAEIIEHAGEPRQVTIAAKLAGRGVDIKLSEESRRAGGLHVIGFGRAMERRLDEQLAGRAGRQGDPGSSQFILSLEDDLMRIFAKQWVSALLQRLGMEEGVPIESGFIGRRILGAQRSLTLQNFSSRNWLLLIDECTRDTRAALFDARDLIVNAYQLHDDIDLLFQRYAKRVLHGARDAEEALARTDQMAETLGIKVGADLYTSNDLAFMNHALKQMLVEEYKLRRLKVGDEAPVRERAVYLRTIDGIWSDFLVKLNRKTEKLNLGDSTGGSSLSQLADLLPMFSGQRHRLLKETDLKLVQNLFKIDDPMAMLTLRTYDASDKSEWDGLFPDESGRKGEHDFELHPESIKPEATLREYLEAYRDDLQCMDNAILEQEKIRATLARFDAYLEKNAFSTENAPAAVQRYFRGRFILLRRRRFEREVLDAFLEYLTRQGLLREPDQLSPEPVLVRRMHLLTGQFTEPLMVIKWFVLVLSLAAYPLIISVPLSPFSSGLILHKPHFNFLPASVEQFFDDTYLGGSWAAMTLGLVGVSPFLLTLFWLRLFRQQWVRPNLVLASPMALATCVGATGMLLFGNRGNFGHLMLGTLQVFGSLLLATMLILLVVSLVNIVELVDGLNFVVILNLTFFLVHEAAILFRQPSLRWWLVAMAATAAPSIWFSSLQSAIDFRVLTTGSLDLQGSDLEANTVTLRITTIFDQQHLVAGFLAAAYVTWMMERFAPGRAWESAAASIAAFGVAVLATLMVGIRTRLNATNIEEFLDGRNGALSGGSQAMIALQRRLIRRCVINAVLRTALFALLMGCGIFLSRQAMPIALFKFPVCLPIFVLLWGYLAIAITRQMRFLFTGYSSTLDVAIPVPQSKEEEDLPWWKRMWARARGKDNGPIELVVLIGGFLEALHLFWEMAEWIYHYLLTFLHHVPPPVHH